MHNSSRALQWTAVKIFIGPPGLVGVLAIIYLISNASFLRALPFITQVSVALLAIALAAFGLAPLFGRWSLHSLAAGVVFGLLVCTIGALAFGLTAFFVYSNFQFRGNVLSPLYNISLLGFPVAAIAGFVFAGAARYYAAREPEVLQ